MRNTPYSRRQFLIQGGLAGAAALSGNMLLGAEPEFATPPPPQPRGKAEACIFIWLGGGACHIDTWDPKRRGDGRKTPGSYYDAIPTAIQGVQVCEHLKRMAPLLDRCILLRTVNHSLSADHAAATNLMHTGRPTTGTIVYPSLGSIVAHELPPREPGIPGYVVMGYPNVTRGPGFLGAKYGYCYLTDTESGPAGFKRPDDVSALRQQRREVLLVRLQNDFVRRNPADDRIIDYAAAMERGVQLSGPQFLSVFDLTGESADLRNGYGGEFGQRLLLSRRLIQAGARFIEVASNHNFVNGTGWDTHNQGQLKQHELIDELDQGVSTLLVDLERQRLLDKTLVVVATEFGRPPDFDSGGGRGHQAEAFSVVLAGGGLRTGQAVGVTDELGRLPVDRPISVPNLHATIHGALGIDSSKPLTEGQRPVPITDHGEPLVELFS